MNSASLQDSYHLQTSRKAVTKLHKKVKKTKQAPMCTGRAIVFVFVYPEVEMFDFGKDEVKHGVSAPLQRFANILNQYPWVNIITNGYTDNVGTDEVNRSLSERRAANARKLMQTDGVNESRMTGINGYGSANLMKDNTTDAGRKANRRVEFLLYKSLKD